MASRLHSPRPNARRPAQPDSHLHRRSASRRGDGWRRPGNIIAAAHCADASRRDIRREGSQGGLGGMLFEDRRDAGRELARIVAALPNLAGAVVLGLPRGGVPVAYEVAHACKLPLDVIVVRKLGVPGQEELAMGAIASGGTVALNPEIVTELRISDETVRAAIEREQPEIERQEREYRNGNPPLDIDGRQVILVDDGLATGASMRAAARAVRPHA